MRVTLDNHELDCTPPTIARAIQLARETASDAGRVVVEVLGDGIALSPKLIDEPPQDDAGIDELSFVTTNPGALVSITLADSQKLLDDAAAAHATAADRLMQGSRADAIDPLREALEAWGMVREVVEKSAALLGLDPRSLTTSAGPSAAVIDGLTDALAEIKRCLSRDDDAALSDTLAYDMPEQVERWRTLLTALENAAKTPPA